MTTAIEERLEQVRNDVKVHMFTIENLNRENSQLTTKLHEAKIAKRSAKQHMDKFKRKADNMSDRLDEFEALGKERDGLLEELRVAKDEQRLAERDSQRHKEALAEANVQFEKSLLLREETSAERLRQVEREHTRVRQYLETGSQIKSVEMARLESAVQEHIERTRLVTEEFSSFKKEVTGLQEAARLAFENQHFAEREIQQQKKETARVEEVHMLRLQSISKEHAIAQNKLDNKVLTLSEDLAAHQGEVARLNSQAAVRSQAHREEVDRLNSQLAAMQLQLQRRSLESKLDDEEKRRLGKGIISTTEEYALSVKFIPDGNLIFRFLLPEGVDPANHIWSLRNTSSRRCQMGICIRDRNVLLKCHSKFGWISGTLKVFRRVDHVPFHSSDFNKQLDSVDDSFHFSDAWPSTPDPQPGYRGGGQVKVVIIITEWKWLANPK